MDITEKQPLLAELEAHILRGEECTFRLNGDTYLLYVWEQCDGSIVHFADANGTDIWQSAPMRREACAAAFRAFFAEY